MTRRIGLYEAKTHLSALVEAAAAGEEIIITKHGKPVAKLIPIRVDSSELIGSLAGRITVKGRILSTGLRWDAESRHPRSGLRARR